MITLFYGERGSGKTQRMVEAANLFAETASGNVVYMDRDFNRMHDIIRAIRLVNVFDYRVHTDVELVAFIKGLLAGNSDIQMIYIDSIAKLTGKKLNKLEWFFAEIEKLNAEFGVQFGMTVEGTPDTMPDFVRKHLDEDEQE